MTKDELISYLRRHAGGYSVPGVDNHNLAKWLEGAPAAPANLAQTIRGITEAYRGTDCGKCAESIGDRLIEVLAAPAAPAPVPLSFTHIDGLAAVDFPSRQWNAAQRFARAIERAHGIGIAASKGEQA
jgi:bacterioferritin-associated ferredoxin